MLLAWIGNTDIKASQGQLQGTFGPTAEAILQCSHTDVFLLSDHSEDASQKYKTWLTNTTGANVTIEQVSLSDPMDFNTIYHSTRKLVFDVQKQKGKDTDLVFDISPGTPAMAAVWIILSKTCFPQAELIGTGQKDEATGKFLMRTISVPFDIAAEPIADILGKSDDALVRLLQGLPAEAPEFNRIIHKCSAMKWVIGRARTVALRDVPVLLLGESGTGKELLARALHKASRRSEKPFVPVNCGAISPTIIESELFGHVKGGFTGAINSKMGLFKEASKGTLFLDEIGDLSPELQCKLLRVLQEGMVRPVGGSKEYPIDVRIIAATNKNLIEEIAKGRFREDLFYRLAVGVIQIPPLRDREGDLGLLVDSFLTKVNSEFTGQPGFKKKQLSTGAKSLLLQYDWPGNVRELENVLKRAAIWSSDSTITKQEIEHGIIHISPRNGKTILGRPLGANLNINDLLNEVVRHYIQRALTEAGGNKSRAAELLGLSNRQTFENWMNKLKVKTAITNTHQK